MTSFRRLIVAIAALSALHGGCALAATEAEYQEANKIFLEANAGDKSKISVARDRFKALSEADAKDPLLLVHYGSATAMMSRTTMLPWSKTSFAEEGMAIQDKAVALAINLGEKPALSGVSTVIAVKFVAASTFLAVPYFFNRGAEGAKLLAEVLGSPSFDAQPLQFRGAVWMRAARNAVDQKNKEEAKRYLDIVIKSGAPQAEQAKTQIAAL